MGDADSDSGSDLHDEPGSDPALGSDSDPRVWKKRLDNLYVKTPELRCPTVSAHCVLACTPWRNAGKR